MLPEPGQALPVQLVQPVLMPASVPVQPLGQVLPVPPAQLSLA